MNGEAGFLHSFGASVPEDPRGARHWGASSCHRLVFGRIVGPNHDAIMRIGGEAPGGGPILSVGIKVPGSNTASRHLGSSIRRSC
jgi:hypothetical protein